MDAGKCATGANGRKRPQAVPCGAAVATPFIIALAASGWARFRGRFYFFNRSATVEVGLAARWLSTAVYKRYFWQSPSVHKRAGGLRRGSRKKNCEVRHGSDRKLTATPHNRAQFTGRKALKHQRHISAILFVPKR